MKKVTFILAIAAVMVACQTQENKQEDMSNQVIENILTRVSVRQFTGEKISDEQTETLLRCALAAPSAVNQQPWKIYIVENEELLRQLGEAMPNCRCQNHPACAFVLCGDMDKVFQPQPDFWIHDVSAATENLLLAVHSMGLGAVWCGVYPSQEKVEMTRSILGIEERFVPLCIVPVGHPAEQPDVKDKYKEENICFIR